MRRLLAVLLSLGLLAAAACSDDGGDTGDGGFATGDGGGAAVSEGADWLVGLLSQIPDNDNSRSYIQATNYEAARDAVGLDRPEAEPDSDEALDYFLQLGGVAGEGAPVRALPAELLNVREEDQLTALAGELGIDYRTIDADLLAGTPPATIELLQGEFDPGAISEAVDSDSTWSDALERREAGGNEYFAWLADGENDPERITSVRTIGEARRLAVTDNLVVWTRADEQIEAVLSGSEGSLADDSAVSGVAEAMVDEGAYSVIMVGDIITSDPVGVDDRPELDVAGLGAYEAIGVGGALTDGEPALIEVIAYPDAAAAEDGADALRTLVEEGQSFVRGQPWAELLTIDTIEVNGSVVTARFGAESPALWSDVLLARDSLVLGSEG